MGVGVAGVGVHGGKGRFADRAVIRMGDDDPRPVRLGGVGEDPIGAHGADDPGDVAPQGEVGDNPAVRVVEEVDVVDTDGTGGGALLVLA